MAENFGRYELVRRLAAGGMGEVFLARVAAGPGPLVVLKRVLPQWVGEAAVEAQFLEEARIAAQLNHPHLLRVLELGSVEGRWFLAMEYVAGVDLRACRGREVPVGVALKLALDAAAALHHAHGVRDAEGRPLQVVHCDVSPHNLLVGRDGKVRLIDFGTAKARARGAGPGQPGSGQGKLAYLSVEQALGEPFDHRSDQFSLGVVLWELLTGARLFDGDDDVQTLKKLEACEVPSPSALRPKVPRAAAQVVVKMLAREPLSRFPDCAAVEAALSGALPQPVTYAHVAAWVEEVAPEAESVQAARSRGPASLSTPLKVNGEFLSPDAWEAAARLLRERAHGVEAGLLTALAEGLREVPRVLGFLAGLGERLREEHLASPPRDRASALELVWNVLSAAERDTVRQLAGFVAPFAVEDAEAAVVLAPAPGAVPLLELLEGLVHARLVTQRGHTAAGAPLFALEEELRALGPVVPVG